MLNSNQFAHGELEKVYLGLQSAYIPAALAGRCQRLLDDIESATKPDDTDILGNGYKNSGAVYSLNVNGVKRINYEWRNGQPVDIDYV
jgi:plasmid maintenance system killer protein